MNLVRSLKEEEKEEKFNYRNFLSELMNTNGS